MVGWVVRWCLVGAAVGWRAGGGVYVRTDGQLRECVDECLSRRWIIE